MKTNTRRTGLALAAPLLALLLQSCSGGLNDEIVDISVEPSTVPSPTADQPTAFKLKVRTNSSGGLQRVFVDAYETGSDKDRDRIAVGDPFDDALEIECTSSMPANEPERREVDCFGADYPSVTRAPGPMRLRLALYQRFPLGGIGEFSDDIKTFTFELQ